MLTARCFLQFALAAQSDQGVMIRDFAFQMITGVKRLGEAIERGEVELRRTPAPDTRQPKRLKTCDSNKALMRVIHETGASGDVYAKINGETNKVGSSWMKHVNIYKSM